MIVFYCITASLFVLIGVIALVVKYPTIDIELSEAGMVVNLDGIRVMDSSRPKGARQSTNENILCQARSYRRVLGKVYRMMRLITVRGFSIECLNTRDVGDGVRIRIRFKNKVIKLIGVLCSNV